MYGAIGSLIRRKPPERRLVLEAVCAVAAARVGLLILPMAWVRRVVNCGLRARLPLSINRRAPVDALIRAVTAAARHSPAGSTCLATALAGQALLRRHGYDCELRIGVRRGEKGDVTAHAWLERNGSVILGGPGSFIGMYTPLPKLEHLIP